MIHLLRRIVPALALACSSVVLAAEPRHVIVMIADGASFTTWRMTSLYEGKLFNQPYEQDGFVRYGMTTFPLNLSSKPTGDDTPKGSYDPAKAWDSSAVPAPEQADKKPDYFAGYRYLKANYTDSAAAGTALATGRKTYNNSINWANSPAGVGEPMVSIYQIALETGRSTGTVTSVPFCHATPAAFAAHNISRNNYHALAKEMLSSGQLSVIMGAGHPEFNNQSEPRNPKYEFIDEETWAGIKSAVEAGQPYNGYTVIFDKEKFEELATATNPPAKVFGLPKVANTLQQARSGYSSEKEPFEVPLNSNVPSLATMSLAALNVLSRDPDGFFLMIEGGAVDWAAHGNQTSRAIEEMVDFNSAVAAVIEFVDRPGDAIDWSNTLLVVTTDHGNGLPLGPDSDTVFFSLPRDNGKGKMPSVRWHSGSHTNELVPMYARGVGAEWFGELTDGSDSNFRQMYQLDARWSDQYIDNTDVFTVCRRVLTESK